MVVEQSVGDGTSASADGLLLTIAITLTMLSALVVLPALMRAVSARGAKP